MLHLQLHRVIASVSGQLRRLAIKMRIEGWEKSNGRIPIMSALCGAVALERMEFEFFGARKKLTAHQLTEWIAVSVPTVIVRAELHYAERIRFSFLNQAKWRTVQLHSTWQFLEFDDVSRPRRAIGVDRAGCIPSIPFNCSSWLKKSRIFHNFHSENDGQLIIFRWVQVQR